MRKWGLRIAIGLSALLFGLAQARRANAQATMTGEAGLVTIPTTDVLEPWHLRAAVYGNGEIETDPQTGNRDLDRVDFSIGVGLLENLEFYSHIPLVFLNRSLATGSDDTTSNGGLRLGLKYRLLDEGNGFPVSFALLGDIVVGIGSDSLPAILDRSTAFGRRETYEVMGILDRTLWTTRSGDAGVLTLNAGGLFFDKPARFSIDDQGTEFRRRYEGPPTTFEAPFEFAAGIKAPLFHWHYGRVSWTEEFRGNTGTVEQLRGAIPMQLFSGFRWYLPERTGLAFQGGLDLGLSGVLDQYRYLLGLAWQTPPPPPPPAPVVAPPPPPPPPPAPVRQKIVLRGVHFDFNKANIRPDSVPILEEAATTLKKNHDVDVVVEGHTDSKGTEEYNDALSLRRAKAVREYLVQLGVPADRLTVRGMGERNPVSSNDTEQGRAQNRRVELLVK